MTYSSGSSKPLTPEAKLADTKWRRINSWWIFPPVLSFGILGWLGFMVAAIRTGKRTYGLFAAVYAAAFVVAMVASSIADGDRDSLASNVSVASLVVAWLVPTIHAALMNRRYLLTLAAKGEWYQTPPTHVGAPAQPFLGVSQDDYYANNTAPSQHPFDSAPTNARPSPTPPVTQQPVQPQSTAGATTFPAPGQSNPQPTTFQANTATAADLARLPGVSPALAQRVIAVRDARGGYRDLDDLAAAAKLQPHELARLRHHLSFKGEAASPPPPDKPPQHGGTGRILDI